MPFPRLALPSVMPFDVLLEKCASPSRKLADLLDRMTPFLGIGESLAGKNVLLKPNLISSRGPVLACTDADFLVVVARWFVDRGARVLVGDSPAFGTAKAVLKRIGALKKLSAMAVEVTEFSASRRFPVSGGVDLGIAEKALACDLLVDIPKIKAHNQMYVSLAVKNLFGVVTGYQKPLLHMRLGASHRRFSSMILDIPALLPRHIVIADGITAMHAEGPLHGRPLDLQCVAAGMNPMAVDTALLSALELAHEKSPLWSEACRRGDPAANPGELAFPLLRPDDFHGSGFLAPDLLDPVRFNPLRFLRGSVKRVLLALRGSW